MSSNSNKLCLCLLPKSLDQLENWIPRIKEADLIELRLDFFWEINFSDLRKLIKIPIILTLRSKDEGGFWEGDESQRIYLYQKAIETKIEYIDIEWKRAKKILPNLKVSDSTQIILSYHTDQRDPDFLKTCLKKMLSIRADIYKLIFTADNLNDNLTAIQLIEMAKSFHIRFLIHGMGDMGLISRLWGAVKGNVWTYVSLPGGEGTAPGQISLATAREDYFLQEKSEQTRLIGLLGYPITHSSGWRLHNRLLHHKKAQKIPLSIDLRDFLYVNFPVQDIENFWSLWKNYFFGLGVTHPHKQSVKKYLQYISDEVQLSDVCNTVYKEKDKWCGKNTDLLAIGELLQPFHSAIMKGILIIGTGATARSSIVAVKRLGGKDIFITGRNRDKGEELAKNYDGRYLILNELLSIQPGCIIQTTPVGMFPEENVCPPGIELFEKNMVVMDVIYNPVFTKFLQLAKEQGCKVISGREMFLLQATYQFEIYSGLKTSLNEIQNIWDKM